MESDSGDPVSPPLESEKLARRRALDDFRPEASKNYDVVRYVPCLFPNAKEMFLSVFGAPRALTTSAMAEQSGVTVGEVFEVLCRLQVLGLVSGDTVQSDELMWGSNLHESTSLPEAEDLFDRAWAVWDA